MAEAREGAGALARKGPSGSRVDPVGEGQRFQRHGGCPSPPMWLRRTGRRAARLWGELLLAGDARGRGNGDHMAAIAGGSPLGG